jgi:hypothetical protein
MEPMQPMKPMTPMAPMKGSAPWWPAELGEPASSGGQDGLRYAFFPQARRLLVERDGQLRSYDSADHRIGGVAQAQGEADPGLTFTSQHGEVALDSLRRV